MDWDCLKIKADACPSVVKAEPLDLPVGGTSTAQVELPLADDIALETAKQGTSIEYYEQHVDESDMDPLYSEPTKREFSFYSLMGVVEWPDSTPEMGEPGERTNFSTTVSIPRKAFELAGATPPSEGDVLRFWAVPFFDDFSVDGQDIPDRGLYFDVIDVDTDGHLFDGPDFTWFKLSCKRRTDFTPERRITNE